WYLVDIGVARDFPMLPNGNDSSSVDVARPNLISPVSRPSWHRRQVLRKSSVCPPQELYGSPEISGRECRFDLGHIIGATYKAGEAGAQATAQSERIRPWLVANRFQALSQASMMSAKLINTELASQWLRR